MSDAESDPTKLLTQSEKVALSRIKSINVRPRAGGDEFDVEGHQIQRRIHCQVICFKEHVEGGDARRTPLDRHGRVFKGALVDHEASGKAAETLATVLKKNGLEDIDWFQYGNKPGASSGGYVRFKPQDLPKVQQIIDAVLSETKKPPALGNFASR